MRHFSKNFIFYLNFFLYLRSNYDKYFKKSHHIKQLIAQDFQKVFTSNHKCDILITPTCFHDTLTYDEYLKQEQTFDEKDFFTACANVAGLPALSLPSIQSSNAGLPVGVQFIGNWKNDEHLLNVANWFMKHNEDNFIYLNVI